MTKKYPNFSTYRIDQIKQWKQELDKIPVNIEFQKQKMLEHQANIASIEKELAPVLHEFDPIEERIKQIEARQQTIQLSKQINKKEKEIKEIESQIIREKENLTKVKIKLAKYDTYIELLKRQQNILSIEMNINDLQNLQRSNGYTSSAQQNRSGYESSGGQCLDYNALNDSKIRRYQDSLNNYSLIEKQLARQAFSPQLSFQIQQKSDKKLLKNQNKVKLETSIERLYKDLETKKLELKKMQTDLNECKKACKNYSKIESTQKLDELLEAAQKEQLPIVQKKLKLEIKKDLETRSIEKCKQLIQSYNNDECKLYTKDRFREELFTDPQKSLTQLLALMRNSVNKFEEINPANQSDQVRLSLFEIKDKLNKFQNYPIPKSNNNDVEQDKSFVQERLYQICGLLWEELDRLNEKDEKLANTVLEILELNPAQRENAIVKYQELRKSNSEYWTHRTLDEVDQEEKIAYNRAYASFQNLMLSLNQQQYKGNIKVYESGIQLLAALDEKRRNEPADSGLKKFHINFLETATALTKTPKSVDLQNKFQHLMEENQYGKPSFCQKVFGAAMMFFSAIATAAVFVPVSPVNLAVAYGGSLGFLSGLGFFMNGRRRTDIDKRAHDFVDKVKNVTILPPAENPELLKPSPSAPSESLPKPKQQSPEYPSDYKHIYPPVLEGYHLEPIKP